MKFDIGRSKRIVCIPKRPDRMSFHPTSIQCVVKSLSPGVKRPQRDEVENKWS
jgi:hypothetical protein